jgi:hypothetical protein
MQADTATTQLRRLRNIAKSIASFFRRILGCRHSQMSRPYTVNDEPYRTCLECGARRRLDRHSWTSQHAYYF